jgi:hypothetical protein
VLAGWLAGWLVSFFHAAKFSKSNHPEVQRTKESNWKDSGINLRLLKVLTAKTGL